jgi:hypothetical protein
MEIRLGFTGASGTGKTTLAKWFAAKYNLPLNPVGSRSIALAMGFASPYDVDKAGQRGPFQHRLVEAKRAWEETHESFVTDRTTMDNLSYTLLHGVHCIDHTLLRKVREGLARYTHIVYCPFDTFCNTGDDPHRVADPTYQELYDIVLRALLGTRLNMFELRVADFETRCEFVDNFTRYARLG